MDIKFVAGQPFKPYEQLMGVFPAARLVILDTQKSILLMQAF